MNACPNHSKTCCNPNHWTLHGDIKRLRYTTHTNVPLTQNQIARSEIICAQSGTTLSEIEVLRIANHITPQWMIDAGFSTNFANRFFAKVKKTDWCWIWDACMNDDGYGYIGIANGTQTVSAHRASHMLHKGPVPENMDVLHNCAPNRDNPSCVNPAHLRVGSDNENLEDATEKYWSRKHRHWTTTCLDEEKVKEILRLCKDGMMKKDVAAKFNITPSYVSAIFHGRRWKRL